MIEYEATDTYKSDFADVIKDGTVEYEGKTYTVEGRHSVEEMDAILRAAMAVHPDKFQSQSAGFSCLGGGASSNVANYYKAIPVTDQNGRQVYTSSIGSVRSDANDGSFLSKLYNAISSKTMSILSYVFMGLAVLCVVAIFIIINKFTDKEKLAKARAQQVNLRCPPPPSTSTTRTRATNKRQPPKGACGLLFLRRKREPDFGSLSDCVAYASACSSA